MSRDLTAADFDPESADPWTLTLPGGGSIELRVVETKQTGDPRPFSVRFAGPLKPELPQATFEASTPPLGQTALFIVPVARTTDAMHYEAVFG